MAARQAGSVARYQLRWLGFRRGTIESWVASGYLLAVFPGVYRVGHAAPSIEAELWAAVLYARRGAALSHGTGAHWRGLINYAPHDIHVSTPHHIQSRPGIVVHGRRKLERFLHKGLPVTSIPQTMLDLAADYEHNVVRHALAQLDFRHELHVPELLTVTGHGKPGSLHLKRAIADHQPKLAYVNGKLEFDWLLWLEERDIRPLPTIKDTVEGFEVDCHWRDHGLVVELDGIDNHSSPAQIKFDRHKDLTLRRSGLTVYRYDWDLVHDQPALVEQEIRQTLAEREGWWNLSRTQTG